MLTAVAIIGVVFGLISILFGLASAFIPTYGGSQTSPTGGLVTAACGAATVFAAVAVLAIT